MFDTAWRSLNSNSSSKKKPQQDPKLVDSATEYRMNHKKRGLFLLFNQMNFHESTRMGTRPGTNEDAAELASLFKGMGFNVMRYTDRSKDNILGILKEGN